ncbi:hypothetical protein SAICODRAFT_36855 [Saitoella complicata NRRL Y-17804]|nr:uncharacterized protein SAICODRAFT_36855 [Saitoella complicata NRRL Y-17804]ODQ50904.1 hypothetical protein SAICODRAFT_36855 [Saitoella complicata NRRL Y-17804]
MCDSEFAAFTQTELGASIISPSSDTTPEDKVELCQMEKKKCARHMSWQQIRQEEIELEEALVREEMKCLQREEEKVRGVVVRRGIVAMEGQREGEVILASDRRDDGSALGEDKREEEEVVEVESPVTANSLHDAVVEPVATPAYSTADAVGEPEVSTTEGTPSATPVLEASAPAPDVSTKTEVEMDDVEGVSAEVQGGEE